MNMKVTYQAKTYKPEDVTGRYVRITGRMNAYTFRVFEAATGRDGTPGHGCTLREYDTDGAELPEELKTKCIASKQTERWD